MRQDSQGFSAYSTSAVIVGCDSQSVSSSNQIPERTKNRFSALLTPSRMNNLRILMSRTYPAKSVEEQHRREPPRLTRSKSSSGMKQQWFRRWHARFVAGSSDQSGRSFR